MFTDLYFVQISEWLISLFAIFSSLRMRNIDFISSEVELANWLIQNGLLRAPNSCETQGCPGETRNRRLKDGTERVHRSGAAASARGGNVSASIPSFFHS